MRTSIVRRTGFRKALARRLFVALAPAALLLIQSGPSLAQEPSEESQEERINELESQVQQLLADKEKERKEAQKLESDDQAFTEAAAEQVKETKGMTPEELDEFNKKIAAGRVTNWDSDWNIGTPWQDHVDKGWWGIKNSPSEFRISGWAQVALLHDFQGNALATVQEFSAGAVPVPQADSPSTGFDGTSSRIMIEFRHLFRGEQKRKNYPGVTHFMFMMDLGGGRTGGDFIPRVRQLWIQHGNLTFGQSWIAFVNGSTWPAYLDRGAPGAIPLVRKPFLRYAIPLSKGMKDSTHLLTLEITEPQPSIYTSDQTITAANARSKAPDFVARYDFNPDWGNLMGAAMARYLLADSSVTPGQSADAWVFAGTITGWANIPTKNKDRLKFNFVMGNGVTGLTWDSGIAASVSGIALDATYVDATNSLETTYLWGIWAGWERPWAPKWSSLFMLSYVDLANIAVQDPLTFNNATTVTGTLMYEPWEHLFVAVEYFWGRQKLFNGQSGQDHRLNLVFRYMINR